MNNYTVHSALLATMLICHMCFESWAKINITSNGKLIDLTAKSRSMEIMEKINEQQSVSGE